MKRLNNLSRDIDELSERLNNLYPDPDDKEGLGIRHWKGKPIIDVKEWKKIAFPNPYQGVQNPFVFVSDGLKFFPDDLVEFALAFEGCSVGPFIDAEPGTKEYEDYKHRLDLYPGEAEWYQEQLAKAKKEDPFEIWIEEYKELLKFQDLLKAAFDYTTTLEGA